MSNLDKVAAIWDNLEKSFLDKGQGLTRAEYLRKLLSDGNFDAVKSLLGKISGDIKTSDDSMKFSSLQKLMLSMANVYYQIPDDLGDLNGFMSFALEGKQRVGNFYFLLDLIRIAQPFRPSKVHFEHSDIGLDVTSLGGFHIISKLSPESMVLKTAADLNALLENEDPRVQDVIAYLQKSKTDMNSLRFPLTLVRDKSSLKNKKTLKNQGRLYVSFEGVQSEVLVVGG